MPRVSQKSITDKVGAKVKSQQPVKSSKTSEARITRGAKKAVTNDSSTPKTASSNKLQTLTSGRRIQIILVIIILLALAYVNKKYLVAATVNGQPITGLELEQRINSSYREKTLTQMVNEKILEQEAAKNGVVVTQQQVNDKVSAMEQQYGGVDSFNSLLDQQGVSRDDFIRQTRLQLMVEKLYEKDATPSAQDIDNYLTQNKNDPAATDAAKFRQTAIETLTQQKLSDIFSQKFQALKQAAKVTTF